MNDVKKAVMTNWRWVMCAMLFFATTVNYMDRQVLSLTFKEFIQPEFHWTDADYGKITGVFSIAYAIFCLFAGKFIDWMGTKKGYLIAICVWSLGAVMHAGCGWVTENIVGVADKAELLNATGALAASISMVSVWLFLACRLILGLGEAGNFPAAIKVTAEYFPKKDRAFATALFNAGASVGALAAPATIPLLAKSMGWEWAFIIIGALGFLWAGVWIFVYDKPEESKHVNEAELEYVHQDEAEAPKEEAKAEKQMSFVEAFKHKQTWSFAFGKFMTDGVWWFFLFWAPAYFQDQFGIKASDPQGIALIFTLYAIVTVVSLFGGYLPKIFVEKKGMEPYAGRMRAMLIFAFFPIFALFAQPLGGIYGPWAVAIIIGIVGAAHQSWSANIFSTTGDMFPKSAVATITGIGAMAGGIGSYLINRGSGVLFTYAENQGDLFAFAGFTGKPAAYMIVFCICAVAYLIGWSVMKILVPRYKPVEIK